MMKMENDLFYCGVGSRHVPEEIGRKMARYAMILEQIGYKLRSGKAKGSDAFFEDGVHNYKNKEIFCEASIKRNYICLCY